MIPAPLGGSSTQAPAPATGLTGAGLARPRRNLDNSVSDNTRAVYDSAWCSFEAWAVAGDHRQGGVERCWVVRRPCPHGGAKGW